MTSLREIIDALEPLEVAEGFAGWRGVIPDGWLQGRTAYGGLSAALALYAAQQSDTDLPPLRSALVGFVGPLSGDVVIRAMRLRRGRNAAFVQADIESEAGLGLRATFVFMGALPSSIDHHVGRAPEFALPGVDTPVFRGNPKFPFTQNFEMLDSRDESVGRNEWLRWVRLADRSGLDPMVELVAVADCLPPAALKLAGKAVPISSMTWQINLLGAQPRTDDGWWLLRARTDFAREGSSSQTMAIWNAVGEPVAEQMQGIAIFG